MKIDSIDKVTSFDSPVSEPLGNEDKSIMTTKKTAGLSDLNYTPYKPVNITGQAKKAYNYYLNRGVKPNVAAGIVGNLYKESGLNPMAVGDKGTAFGVAQWRGDRLSNLKKYASSKGRSYTDLNTQLDFILDEQGENQVLSLMSNQSPEEAAKTFADKYERPNPKYADYSHRISVAKQLGQMKYGGKVSVDNTRINKPYSPLAIDKQIQKDRELNRPQIKPYKKVPIAIKQYYERERSNNNINEKQDITNKIGLAVSPIPILGNIYNTANTITNGLVDLAQGEFSNVGESIVNLGLSKIGARIPFDKTYKLNPFAFKPNKNKFYRQVEDETLSQYKKSGLIRGKEIEKPTKGISLQRDFGDDAYFQKGDLYYKDGKYTKNLVEANLPESNFQPKVNNRVKSNFDKSGGVGVPKEVLNLSDKNIQLYKQHWLQGYKKVSKMKLGGFIPKYVGGAGEIMGLISQGMNLGAGFIDSTNDPENPNVAKSGISGFIKGNAALPGIGGILGGIAGIRDAKKQRELFQKKKDIENRGVMDYFNIRSKGILDNYNTQGEQSSFYAKGGIPNPQYEVEHGEVIVGNDVKLTGGKQLASNLHKVVGKTHDQFNPNTVNGTGEDGQGGQFIFSNRLQLGGKTFAKLAEGIAKQKSKAEEMMAHNDYIFKNTGQANAEIADAKLMQLAQIQEGLKEKNNPLGQFKYGGNPYDKGKKVSFIGNAPINTIKNKLSNINPNSPSLNIEEIENAINQIKKPIPQKPKLNKLNIQIPQNFNIQNETPETTTPQKPTNPPITIPPLNTPRRKRELMSDLNGSIKPEVNPLPNTRPNEVTPIKDRGIREGEDFLTNWYAKRNKVTKPIDVSNSFNAVRDDLPAFQGARNQQVEAYYDPNDTKTHFRKNENVSVGTATHEFTHSIDDRYGNSFNNRNTKFGNNKEVLKTDYTEIGVKPKIDKESVVGRAFGEKYDYYTKPTEVYARLNELRQVSGLDPNYTVTLEDIQKIKKDKSHKYNQLFTFYSDEDIMNMWNGLSSNLQRESFSEQLNGDNGLRNARYGGVIHRFRLGGFIPKFQVGGDPPNKKKPKTWNQIAGDAKLIQLAQIQEMMKGEVNALGQFKYGGRIPQFGPGGNPSAGAKIGGKVSMKIPPQYKGIKALEYARKAAPNLTFEQLKSLVGKAGVTVDDLKTFAKNPVNRVATNVASQTATNVGRNLPAVITNTAIGNVGKQSFLGTVGKVLGAGAESITKILNSPLGMLRPGLPSDFSKEKFAYEQTMKYGDEEAKKRAAKNFNVDKLDKVNPNELTIPERRALRNAIPTATPSAPVVPQGTNRPSGNKLNLNKNKPTSVVDNTVRNQFDNVNPLAIRQINNAVKLPDVTNKVDASKAISPIRKIDNTGGSGINTDDLAPVAGALMSGINYFANQNMINKYKTQTPATLLQNPNYQYFDRSGNARSSVRGITNSIMNNPILNQGTKQAALANSMNVMNEVNQQELNRKQEYDRTYRGQQLETENRNTMILNQARQQTMQNENQKQGLRQDNLNNLFGNINTNLSEFQANKQQDKAMQYMSLPYFKRVGLLTKEQQAEFMKNPISFLMGQNEVEVPKNKKGGRIKMKYC